MSRWSEPDHRGPPLDRDELLKQGAKVMRRLQDEHEAGDEDQHPSPRPDSTPKPRRKKRDLGGARIDQTDGVMPTAVVVSAPEPLGARGAEPAEPETRPEAREGRSMNRNGWIGVVVALVAGVLLSGLFFRNGGVHIGGTSVEQVAQGTVDGLGSANGQQAIANAVGDAIPDDYARSADVSNLGTKIDGLGTAGGNFAGLTKTWNDTLRTVIVDPVTGDKDTVEVVKTRSTDLWAELAKLQGKGIKRPPSSDDAAMQRELAALRKQVGVVSQQVSGLPKQMAVTVTSGGGTTMAPAVASKPIEAPAVNVPQPAPRMTLQETSSPTSASFAPSPSVQDESSSEGSELSAEELAARKVMPRLMWYEERPDASGKMVTFTVVAAEAARATGSGPYYMCGAGRFSWKYIENTTAQAFQDDPNGNISKRGVYKGFQVACGNHEDPAFCPIAEEFEGRLGTMVQYKPRFRAEFVPSDR